MIALAVARHVAFTIALFVAAFAIGRRLVGARRFDGAVEELAISTTVGLGVLALALYLLALAGLFTRGPITLAVGAMLVASRRSFARLGPTLRPRAAVAVAVAVAVPAWLLTLYPPCDWDAVSYHLPLARAAVESGAWRATPWPRYPAFPSLTEVLFALGLLVGDAIDAHLVSFVVLVAFALLVGAAARRLAGARAGLWAAALLVGNPAILFLGTSGYVDLTLALFTVAAVWALLRFLDAADDDGGAWLLLAGALSGFAAMAKYSGLFAVVLVGVVALARAPRRLALLALSTAALVALPTYLFIALSTGNPIHPFLGQWLGLGPWSRADVAGQIDDLSRLGTPRTLGALARLPWDLAVDPGRFRPPAPSSPLVGGALIAFVAGVARDARLRRLGAVALALMLAWFLTARGYRYLVPVLALVCLGAGVAAARLVERPAARLRSAARVLTVVVAAALVSPSGAWVATELSLRGAPRLDAAAWDAYLTPRLPAYGAFRWAAARSARDGGAIYQLRFENHVYYGGSTVRGDWFGEGRYDDVRRLAGAARPLHAHLRRLGVRWLLVPLGETLPTRDPDFRRLFARRYEDRVAAVYELSRAVLP